MHAPFTSAMQKAGAALDVVTKRGTVSGRRPKFFYFQLRDGYRMAHAAGALYKIGLNSDVISGEAVEVLLRRVVEQAILTHFMHENSGDETIDRFCKTSAREFVRSFQMEHDVDDKDLPVPQLPDYREMASSSPWLYPLYQRLSYLAHPRSALPYSVVEWGNKNSRSIDSLTFFKKRCDAALSELARCIELITQIFELEDNAYTARVSK